MLEIAVTFKGNAKEGDIQTIEGWTGDGGEVQSINVGESRREERVFGSKEARGRERGNYSIEKKHKKRRKERHASIKLE